MFNGYFIPTKLKVIIVGIPSFNNITPSDFFRNWQTDITSKFSQNRLKLQMVHWLNSITCYCIEDMYLSACVQVEKIILCQNNLSFFDGMVSASNRYNISPLSADFKNMRNDLVHEGVLSGTNFPNKTKAECSEVVAQTFNWIDKYVFALFNRRNLLTTERWLGVEIKTYLPSVSIRR